MDLTSDFDFIDPALDYFSHGWQMQYATSCKLLSFPDKEASAGGTKIVAGSRHVAAGGFGERQDLHVHAQDDVQVR